MFAWHRLPALLALLFALVLLPTEASYGTYHGDERYYTNSVFEMELAGDLTTPRWADGSLRANKPLLPYWMVIAGFRILGVGPVGARLPFMLCIAALVLLTGSLARRATGDARAGAIAAALYASSTAAIAAARRSMPDAPLALGVGLVLYGLIRLVIEPEDRRAAWSIWIGAGIAVAAKLALGGVALVYAGIVCVVLPGRGSRMRCVFHPGATLAGLGIAAAGVVPLYLGNAGALDQAVSDQISSRVHTDIGAYIANVARYALDPVRHFAPLSLAALALVVMGWRTRRRAEDPPWRGVCLGWIMLCVLLFAVDRHHRGRYLLPCYPAVAALFAAPLARVAAGSLADRRIRILCRWILRLAALACGAVALLIHREPEIAALVGAAAAGALLLNRLASRRPDLAVPAAALGWLLGVVGAGVGLRAATVRSPVADLARDLGDRTVVVVEHPEMDRLWDVSTHLRIHTGGRVRAVHAGGPAEEMFGDEARIVPLSALEGAEPSFRYRAIRRARGRSLLDWALHQAPEPVPDRAPDFGLVLPRDQPSRGAVPGADSGVTSR